MKVTSRADALEAASAAAWRERYVLEAVLLKLETEEALVETGRTRWSAHADRELKLILEQVRLEELTTATSWQGLADDPALGEPWASIFGAHRRAIEQLVGEVATAAARCPVGAPGDARRQVKEWAWKRAVDSEIIDLSERWRFRPPE